MDAHGLSFSSLANPVAFVAQTSTGVMEQEPWTRRADGSGQPVALSSPSADAPDRDPGLYPAGVSLVHAAPVNASSVDRARDSDIYGIALGGSGLTRLTEDPGTATDPVYSMDGRRILFVSTRDSQHSCESEIYVMAAGGDQRRLTGDARPQNSAPSSGRTE
jgi:dipeptidyl aminopeptidase/acylaminoacyl peptidase